MTLEIVTIPCRSDNYAFALHDAKSGATAVVDVPDAAPVQAELVRRGWILSDILITHHHNDHVDGVEALRKAYGCVVWGAKADAHRLPPLDRALSEGDTVRVGTQDGQVMDVSGHTLGHVAFYFPGSAAVFTADSLMALGCGRLFEGDAATMFASLSKLAALPPETLVCSGHEYTAANARFALSVDPDNAELRSRAAAIEAARAAGQPTVPSRLSDELATNPFLRAGSAAIRAQVDLPQAPEVEVFAEVRRRKDRF